MSGLNHVRADDVRVASARLARSAHLWFRAFRRTRPFWGAVWLTLGGYWILHLSMMPLGVVLRLGFSAMGGWFVAGGMIMCGLTACLAPSQRKTAGLLGTILSIASLVASNFGGFFIGMALGLVGATMILVWGPKPARARTPKVAA